MKLDQLQEDTRPIRMVDIKPFLAFLDSKKIEHKDHSDPMKARDKVVHYKGHWMALLWNKNFKSFTIDKRLKPLVDEFNKK